MIESYDGLCGNIPTFASFDLRIRCKYDLNHKGPCSYEKYRSQFELRSSCRGPDATVFDHDSVIITSDKK